MSFTPLLGNRPVKGLATLLDLFIKEVNTQKGQLHHSWSYSSLITSLARRHCDRPVNLSTSDLLNSPVEGLATLLDFFIREVNTQKGQLHNSW